MLEVFLFLLVGLVLGMFVAKGVAWLYWHRNRRQGIAKVLRDFFRQKDVQSLPVLSRSFATVDIPNLHLAIEQFVAQHKATSRVVGCSTPYGDQMSALKDLTSDNEYARHAVVAPVQYRQVDTGVESQMQCVEKGIHLIEFSDARIAAYVRTTMFPPGQVELEVLASSLEAGAAFVESVRAAAIGRSIYRGKIISLECDAEAWGGRGCSGVRFHAMPEIKREEIILPTGTLELLERNTVGFFQHTEALRRSGRSVKRGILLYGKPGTGKTYTAKWLARAMKGVTVILLSGEQLGLVKQCCQMARMLAPSLVIMEDVDLIAGARDERRHPAFQITLHQLLNEMDGLGSDAEVMFILTTNRPDVIEQALISRPGRIDQTIEYPLPDAECRRRLIALYGRGLELAIADMDSLILKMQGASPAFVSELMRKSALIALEADSLRGGLPRVTDEHVRAAMQELLLCGGNLTREVLGFADQSSVT